MLRHDAHFLKEGGRLLFLHSTLVLTDGDGRRGEELVLGSGWWDGAALYVVDHTILLERGGRV